MINLDEYLCLLTMMVALVDRSRANICRWSTLNEEDLILFRRGKQLELIEGDYYMVELGVWEHTVMGLDERNINFQCLNGIQEGVLDKSIWWNQQQKVVYCAWC